MSASGAMTWKLPAMEEPLSNGGRLTTNIFGVIVIVDKILAKPYAQHPEYKVDRHALLHMLLVVDFKYGINGELFVKVHTLCPSWPDKFSTRTK